VTLSRLVIFNPSGVVPRPAVLRRAARRLAGLGFEVELDEAALARHQRFAGDDATRLAAVHRVAAAAPPVALAARGGYGLTRLLDAIAWKRVARSVERGTRWVGHSDFTVLHCALFAHTGAPGWAGPVALDQFGRSDEEGGVDDVTAGCFGEAMRGELKAVGFRTEAGFDGLAVRGPLWGGNLAMLCSLLGTPHFPRAGQVKGGILYLEDVNEHPFRVERRLLQLAQAGVLGAQRAVLLGHFTNFKPAPVDRGYRLRDAIERVRAATRAPLLTGLPFGHVPTMVCLPFGRRAQLLVDGRDVLLGWA
jgi:muramoyltetrapeptide carboxypeptidase